MLFYLIFALYFVFMIQLQSVYLFIHLFRYQGSIYDLMFTRQALLPAELDLWSLQADFIATPF